MTRAELLAEHRAIEAEGDRSPARHVVDPRLENTIDIDHLALERLIDNKWLAQLQTMTPQKFGKLSDHEQRVYTAHAERFEKRFAEIANMLRRNCVAPALPSPFPLEFARVSA